ncbi:MAG TPA: hypothetical protein VFD39_02275 [Trueperaceae bacterium]|nr:hypothetical protein [Trueperaceae bacterium]
MTEQPGQPGKRPLVLALPKGRVLAQAVARLREAGLPVDLTSGERAMRHESAAATVLLMRNADVPAYVDLGVADAGVVGRDVLLESGSRLYVPVDLGVGVCRIALIRPLGATRASRPLTWLATLFPPRSSPSPATSNWPASPVSLTPSSTSSRPAPRWPPTTSPRST